MKEIKFWVLMSSGEKFEVAELDFNNLQGRIAKGATNGWYKQRGETKGDRHGWHIQFKDVAGFYADGNTEVAKPASDVIDVEKRLPAKVGKIEDTKEETCTHDWNRPETYIYVTEVVNGINRYYKACPECAKRSTLVKKREVELAMKADDKSLDDVEIVTGS